MRSVEQSGVLDPSSCGTAHEKPRTAPHRHASIVATGTRRRLTAAAFAMATDTAHTARWLRATNMSKLVCHEISDGRSARHRHVDPLIP